MIKKKTKKTAEKPAPDVVAEVPVEHARKATKPEKLELEKVVNEYGDLVYDLCWSVLGDSMAAQQTCRAIFKEVRRSLPNDAYSTYFRAWLLRIACEKIRTLNHRFRADLEDSSPPLLDGSPGLNKLDHYFHRLATDEQILLLFRDKYGLPYSEISNATGLPEDSIKVRRQQALRALEEWVWEAGA